MSKGFYWRLWFEVALAITAGLSFALTLAWPDWIELTFGVEPDSGDGHFEWAFLAISLFVLLFTLVMARRDWRRASSSRQSAARTV